MKEEILEILACPQCKSDLEYSGGELECSECGEKYEVEEGIPRFLK